VDALDLDPFRVGRLEVIYRNKPACPVPIREWDLEQFVKQSWLALLSNVSWVELLTTNLLPVAGAAGPQSVSPGAVAGRSGVLSRLSLLEPS